MFLGVDWFGFAVTFIGAFILGLLFGFTINEMRHEDLMKETENQNEIHE